MAGGGLIQVGVVETFSLRGTLLSLASVFTDAHTKLRWVHMSLSTKARTDSRPWFRAFDRNLFWGLRHPKESRISGTVRACEQPPAGCCHDATAI
jgi:hypothetical protein